MVRHYLSFEAVMLQLPTVVAENGCFTDARVSDTIPLAVVFMIVVVVVVVFEVIMFKVNV